MRARVRGSTWPLVVASVMSAGMPGRVLGQGGGGSPVHGLWVWKTPTVLAAPGAADRLRDFCRAQGIDEVYISASTVGQPASDAQLAHLVSALHGAGIRVEALLSSTDADEEGKYRDKLLGHVQKVVQFDRQHGRDRFDGIHLDIEPQQRAENKGPGNLRFLPGLVAAYAAVRAEAAPAGLTVDADIQNKLLKGSREERRMLLSALPRLTLMMYEVSAATDDSSAKIAALRKASQGYLDMAYEGLDGSGLATMVIALRTPDYASELPGMLSALDDWHRHDPHYAGWARHSYNDVLSGTGR